MTAAPASRARIVLDVLYYVVAIGFFLALFSYFWTSEGGPTLLAMRMVPITFVLFVLSALRENDLYPALSPAANGVIAAVYIACALAVAWYMNAQYYEIGTSRAGDWNTTDMFMGGIMAVLVLEYSRRRHMPLFILNILLLLYAVYGYVVPGIFHHGGLSWTRVVTAMSVEATTGVFSNLPQIALTVVGAFLLVLSLLSGFGCIDSLLRTTKRVAARSAHALPQSAVVGSMCVGTVSGSGAANAITIGSATIPAMIGAGMPPATAAAIESASSLGGQLMPPVMGVSAFLMAEFLGKSYFDVVARGYVPALIYYITVAVSVYLLAVRYRTRVVAGIYQTLSTQDWINLAAFVAVIGGLVGLMAAWNLAPMFAALYVFVAIGGVLLAVHLFFSALRSTLACGPHEAGADVPRRLCRDDRRPDPAARYARDHDRRPGHYRRSDQARFRADRDGWHQSRGDGGARVSLRRRARHGTAAGADLHSCRDRDRPTDDQGRRESVGGALLRVLLACGES